MENKIQKIGVTAFIVKENKLLIVRRSKNEFFLPEYYEMPGGKVEFGESLEDALLREVKEETGLEIKVVKPYATFSYLSDDGGRHTVDVQFIVEAVNEPDNVKISSAHDEFKWIKKEEIDNYKISDQMKTTILKGFNNL
jgi:8-oxo-dGTP diphosphatase